MRKYMAFAECDHDKARDLPRSKRCSDWAAILTRNPQLRLRGVVSPSYE